LPFLLLIFVAFDLQLLTEIVAALNSADALHHSSSSRFIFSRNFYPLVYLLS